MQLFSLQLSNWRVARDRKIEVIDTTVRSGDRLFSPSWDIVMGSKNGAISWAEYTAAYRQQMLNSWNVEREAWRAFVRRTEPMAIACYCKPGANCHRHLLIGIFREICQASQLPFEYYGELLP